jgi:two-component system, cell cycle response regulator DivK
MKQTVLLVEDNLENRYLTVYLLEKNGFEVIAATTGVSALLYLKTVIPNIILMDIQLPDIDGYELTRRIKKEAAYTDIPVIAVSSFAMPGEKTKALEAGCCAYIEKPIDPTTFVQVIKSHLP